MRVQDCFGLFKRGSDRHRDEIFLGHHARNGQVEARLEAQVAIGENPHQLAVLGHRHAGDAVALHYFERVADLLLRINSDRIDDHPAFGAFHPVHFFGLALDRHVAVDQAQPALLRQRDRQVRFGDPGPGISLCGDDVAAGRKQENVVECKSFGDRFRNHQDVLLMIQHTHWPYFFVEGRIQGSPVCLCRMK